MGHLNETAYKLWIACRDKEVSTDAISMIVDALRAAEQRALEAAASVVQWADQKAAIRALFKEE